MLCSVRRCRRLSVCLYRIIVAKRCVLEQKLLYWQPIQSRIWEIDWYQNEWPWPSFRGCIKVMSTVTLHSTLNISETVRDRGLVPKDHQYEMAYGLSNSHVTDDVTKVLWGSTVSYPSDSLASCLVCLSFVQYRTSCKVLVCAICLQANLFWVSEGIGTWFARGSIVCYRVCD